ncbi:hypothetical protein A2634_02040 [Candidatus Amesbacteria bacterium RIFCSPHIGHO2_01_FULL_48_32]|uniref:Antitoxin n=1 Tax=Candidatus Amesbacteria bacterium RIFCSPLOWO2_01_FULL_48_25 TaxID=1797259 RepID=A0A1F4ZDF0_9BACT|nr:MAG: hypothetical protein A2634_02040 [Candidatus Amesbacteria bacterium RIFCSPHIGHO2_01_FULL_48_32]OGD04370.1 MAG: hypothetical protein A2989_05040 [Candidatus Amesbacteria bacterium RIFCSPLOWO2_01_FULL_48_25]HJZ06206.1 hypothetical protein [Patescibacteria group bacterium]
MTQINASQARQDFLQILNRAYAGEEFLVTKNRIVMARISPVRKEKKIVKRRILPEVFGMWKDRWPASKSSVDIVDEWRRKEEMRSYGG